MTRLIPLAAVLTLAACTQLPTPQQVQAAIITLDQTAMACHAAVKAATSVSNSKVNVLNGSRVLVMDPACAALTLQAADLVASAINAKAKVVPGAVSSPAK